MISENESSDALNMPKMHVNTKNKVKGNEGLYDMPPVLHARGGQPGNVGCG